MSNFKKQRFPQDLPYINEGEYDKNKVGKLFTEIENLNIYNLKKISLTDKIPLDITNEEGSNLIHRVLKKPSNSQNQIINIIKYLVENNVNPDQPNKDNNTPLHFACENQEHDVIKYLLEIGCNPNFRNNLGMTPMHYYLSGIYKERILDKDFLSIVTKKEVLDVEQIELDKKIIELIKDDEELTAIKNTIKEILNNYKSDKIDKLVVDSQGNLLVVKGVLDKFIENYIKNIFNFDNLKIHEKKTTSLQTNHPTLSILTNINYKNRLKLNIKNAINELKNILFNNINITTKFKTEVLNNYFEEYILDNDFKIDNTGNTTIFTHNGFMFFNNIPTQNYLGNDNVINDNVINNRIFLLKQQYPHIDEKFLANQVIKILLLYEIININIPDEKNNFKEKLKRWLFYLMNESNNNIDENLYDNEKSSNEEVKLMNKLIDNYVDGDFKYEDRLKILEKLVIQKNSRLFLNNLLLTDTIFVIKQCKTLADLNYYFSIMYDITNLQKDKYLPSTNMILDRGYSNISTNITITDDLKKMHNYAYFNDCKLLMVESLNLQPTYTFKDVMDKIKDYVNNNIINILNDLKNDMNKKLSEVSIRNYDRIVTFYLKSLSRIYYKLTEVLEFYGRNIDIKKTYILDTNKLNNVIEKINFININYFIYYYYVTITTIEKPNIKIPKFYYYKIPTSYTKDSDIELTGNLIFDDNGKLIFDDNGKLISLNSFDSRLTPEPSKNDKTKIDLIFGQNSLYNYPDLMDINLYSEDFDIRKEFLIFSRKDRLPPALWDNNYLKIFTEIYLIKKMKQLYDIYNSNDELNKLIKYNNIIPDSEKNIINLNTIGLKMKENLINIINTFVNQIINDKLLNKSPETPINIPVESNFKINLNDTSLIYRNITNIEYYEYNLKPEKEKNFLIYSDDYSSFQIEKSLLESKINIDGLKYLIENGGSLSIEDNNGKNPLDNIIKNLNVGVYEKVLDLLKINIDLNLIDNKKILDYFINYLKMDIDKYLAGSVKESIIKFSIDQANDIDIKIKASSEQLNNKYYLLSFKIMNYLSNQLIGVLNKNYNDDESIIELLNINDVTELYLSKVDGFKNNKDLLLYNLNKNLNKELENLRDKKEKLEKVGKDNINIDNKIVEIENIITTNSLNSIVKNTKYGYNIPNLDNGIFDLYGKIENIVELDLFNDLFNDNNYNLEEDHLLVLPKILSKEKEFLENLTMDNWKKYKIIIKFYNIMSDNVEQYFIGNQFMENNELRRVIFDLLVYLTKTVILSHIEILVTKVLIEYFDSIYPSSKPNITLVKGILYHSTFTGNKNHNSKKLYNLAEIIVKNSVYIFNNNTDKETFMEKSIENILDEWFLDLIKNTTYNISENSQFINKFRIELNNTAFIKNIINNWLVVVENNFKFIINHYRLLKMLDLTIINT
jgi:ankyrin repeat protein